jgi:hypothetical protein
MEIRTLDLHDVRWELGQFGKLRGFGHVVAGTAAKPTG